MDVVKKIGRAAGSYCSFAVFDNGQIEIYPYDIARAAGSWLAERSYKSHRDG